MTCPTGKLRHQSRDAAKAHVRGLRSAGKMHGKLVVYKCPVCGLFHVGHSDAGKSREELRRIAIERYGTVEF